MNRAAKAPRNAFSMIELLLVVAILGIVAAVVVPRISTSTSKAVTCVRESHLTQMNQAIERYYFDHGDWPTALNDLVEGHMPGGIPADPEGGSFSFNSTSMRAEYTP